MSDTIVVTRHAALVQYLIEQGLVSASVSVITHATPDDVRDKHVIGVLPLSLAASAGARPPRCNVSRCGRIIYFLVPSPTFLLG